MPRSRRTKTALPIGIVIIIVIIGYFVPLPPAVLGLLPPEIARLLPQPKTTEQDDVDPARLPKTAGSFDTAKDWLYQDIYPDRRQTFYCDCPYTESRRVLLAQCGLQGLAQIRRAQRVEAEHIIGLV